MQAAHAIACGRIDDAARALRDALEWLRQRPSQLELHARDIADSGHVLVLLGQVVLAERAVAGLQQIPRLPESVRRACTFVAGLCTVVRERQPADAAEASLSREGESSWSHALRAAAHRQRGELVQENRELLLAARQERSPLLLASLLRVTRAAGDRQATADLEQALRRDVETLDLRRLQRHPLLDPAFALASLALRGTPR